MTVNNLQVIFPNQRHDVRARVVEHTLVATFRTSNPPTVWRMDLEKNHSFAVAIQKRSTDWELGVMSPKGEFTVVARFDDRAAVDEAMAEVETAMFSNPNSTGIKVWRLSAMTAAMVFLILFGYLVIRWLEPAAPMPSPRMAGTERPLFVPTPMLKGVAQDADTVLGKE